MKRGGSLSSDGRGTTAGTAAESWRLVPVTCQNYILLSLLWISYCAIHSALISMMGMNFFRSILGKKYRFYRLFFNTFSIAALVPLLMYSYSAQWKTQLIITWKGGMGIIQTV
jgi:uncharacterized membrane protein YuzA (DUF378 family)